MSVIATAVKHLLAAGVNGEALVAAIAEMEASQPKDAAAEKRRAWDRERKRAAKEAGKAALSTGIPLDSAESAESAECSPAPSPPNENNLTPHTLTPGNNKPTRESRWPCPEGVDPRHWSDFLANRKRKRLTNSQTAHEGVLADLANLADAEWPPGRLVQHAAAKGWGSINYPSDGPRNAPRNGTNGTAGNRGGSLQPARILAAGAGFLSGPAAGSPH